MLTHHITATAAVARPSEAPRTRLAARLVAAGLVALSGIAIAAPGAISANGQDAPVVQAGFRGP